LILVNICIIARKEFAVFMLLADVVGEAEALCKRLVLPQGLDKLYLRNLPVAIRINLLTGFHSFVSAI
jgi:hypothetical protein